MGDSPFNLTPPDNLNNPVLTGKDVTDVQADFIADPFMVNENNVWYMFFEVWNSETDQGDIGLAVSNDGLSWTYKQIVLDDDFTFSYPYVFKWKNQYYMIPETAEAEELRLYKATKFPFEWTLEETLLKGNYIDPSIFYFNNMWWLFAETNPKGHDTLSLYYAVNLKGPWFKHQKSPIIEGDANIARPGGRVIVLGDRIFRFTQDCEPTYGNQLRAFEIVELTTETYKEKGVIGNPILKASGVGWNEIGMHQIDPHQLNNGKWIACVDGRESVLVFGLKY